MSKRRIKGRKVREFWRRSLLLTAGQRRHASIARRCCGEFVTDGSAHDQVSQ